MLGPQHLAPAARRQLAAWEAIADGWPTTDWRAAGGQQLVRLCDRCGHGVLLVTDRDGKPYRYTPEQERAQIVLHLRNHHADLDPDR